MANDNPPPESPDTPPKQVWSASDAAPKSPARSTSSAYAQTRKATSAPPEVVALAPPGLLGNLDEASREALLAAVDWQHTQAPNPNGSRTKADNIRDNGRWAGPQNIPGPLRARSNRLAVCRTYLEQGIYQLHCREKLSLSETAESLGYTYAHTVKTWADMRRRAFDAEGGEEIAGGVRAFLLHHLERAIEIADDRMGDNAAYGAVLIRACEALKDIAGVDKDESSSLNVAELAAMVKGRSPLLLEQAPGGVESAHDSTHAPPTTPSTAAHIPPSDAT